MELARPIQRGALRVGELSDILTVTVPG